MCLDWGYVLRFLNFLFSMQIKNLAWPLVRLKFAKLQQKRRFWTELPIEVYQTRHLGYWATLPAIKTWGGVSRRVTYCRWGSWRCQELSLRHQRVFFYPQMVKNGKTINQLWKIAKLKKITFWSAFFGLVGLNWGCCSKITQGWGGVTHGGSAMGPNWAKWWFWPPPMKIKGKNEKKKNFFLIFEVNLGKNIECNGLYQKKNEKVAYLWKKWGKMTKK